MLILLIIVLVLCVFQSLSLVVLGSALMKNTEILNTIASISTSIPPDKPQKFTDVAGFRMDAEENLMDIQKTEFPL